MQAFCTHHTSEAGLLFQHPALSFAVSYSSAPENNVMGIMLGCKRLLLFSSPLHSFVFIPTSLISSPSEILYQMTKATYMPTPSKISARNLWRQYSCHRISYVSITLSKHLTYSVPETFKSSFKLHNYVCQDNSSLTFTNGETKAGSRLSDLQEP